MEPAVIFHFWYFRKHCKMSTIKYLARTSVSIDFSCTWVFVVLRINSRPLGLPRQHSTTELHTNSLHIYSQFFLDKLWIIESLKHNLWSGIPRTVMRRSHTILVLSLALGSTSVLLRSLGRLGLASALEANGTGEDFSFHWAPESLSEWPGQRSRQKEPWRASESLISALWASTLWTAFLPFLRLW